MTNREQLQRGIAALESQRGTLDDDVLEMALAPLRSELARLAAGEQALRQITVLFADIVGSTELVERLDPEDAGALMDSALRRFGEVVAAHRGRILRYMGDGLLAVFGAEGASESDAERAVLVFNCINKR